MEPQENPSGGGEGMDSGRFGVGAGEGQGGGRGGRSSFNGCDIRGRRVRRLNYKLDRSWKLRTKSSDRYKQQEGKA